MRAQYYKDHRLSVYSRWCRKARDCWAALLYNSLVTHCTLIYGIVSAPCIKVSLALLSGNAHSKRKRQALVFWCALHKPIREWPFSGGYGRGTVSRHINIFSVPNCVALKSHGAGINGRVLVIKIPTQDAYF